MGDVALVVGELPGGWAAWLVRVADFAGEVDRTCTYSHRKGFSSEGEAREWLAAQKALLELPADVEVNGVESGGEFWLEREDV